MGIVDYIKDVKELETKRLELCRRKSEKMGFEVSVRLSLGNVIMFQVFKSRHLRYCAEHFGVKGHIFHTVVDGYHHLVIKGSYEGHKAEVSCVLSNEDYKEYKKEHVK